MLAQDTRYALRMMRKNAGYTAAAVLILGLGIGVNTSIFSVVNSVLLKPLPYTQGDQLVVLRQPEAKLGIDDIGFSPLEVDDYRRQNRSLSGVVEYHGMTFTLLGGSEAHRVRTGVVSHDFFDLFGVKPMLGRTFLPDDEQPGAPAVLVLSYEFWKQTEHGDPEHRRQGLPDERPAAHRHRRAAAHPAVPQRERRLHDDHLVPVPLAPRASIANRGFRAC